MGVVYSSAAVNLLVDVGSGTTVDTEILKSSSSRIEALMRCYLKFQYPPMIDNINLHSYFMNAEKFGQYNGEVDGQVALLWKIYEVKSICYIQEVIACLVLLSECDWHKKLSYIFDIFKCSGNDEMNYDDVVLGGQVIAMSLHRLWGTGEWDQVEWSRLTETLADEAYSKLEKDLESGITKAEFVNWAAERFKEHRSVSSTVALMKLFSSAYA